MQPTVFSDTKQSFYSKELPKKVVQKISFFGSTKKEILDFPFFDARMYHYNADLQTSIWVKCMFVVFYFRYKSSVT